MSDLDRELGVLIEEEVSSLLRSRSAPPQLAQAVEYALSGGKRIRPRLALAFCRDLGGRAEDILGAAVALEVLHAASLVHDDLPSLDNDDMRRGQPSCHKKFGEATALLAGDFMIALAFGSLQRSRVNPAVLMRMSELLAQSFADLCCGQQLDLNPAQSRGGLAELHELKTGALFAAAIAFGAWGAGCEDKSIAPAKLLGRGIGLGFQIVDDYLDLFGTLTERGRLESSDLRNNKPTFFNGADKAGGLSLLEDTRQRVNGMLSAFGKEAGRPESRFESTKKILDTIFERVKNSSAAQF